MEKIVKTAEQIAEQIENWFLQRGSIEEDHFVTYNRFQLFRHLDSEESADVLQPVNLNSFEIPVLLLFSAKDQFIICSTERLIRVDPGHTTYLPYSDFKGPGGYTQLPFPDSTVKDVETVARHLKSYGSTAPFRILKNDGSELIWDIPTGSPGFGFWNLSRKFEMIGRRYVIREYLEQP